MDTVPVKKTTNSVIWQARKYMIFFGLVIGCVFPFFSMLLLDVPAEKVLTPKYFVACILAGLLVAVVSQLLVHFTVLREFDTFSKHLLQVTGNIGAYKKGQMGLNECTDCYLEISSSDVIGDVQSGMNDLIHSIRSSFAKQELTDSYHQLLNQVLDTQQLTEATLRYFNESLKTVVGGEIFIYQATGLELAASLFVHREVPGAYRKFLQDVIDSGRVHVSGEELVLVDSGQLSEVTKGHLVFPIQTSREQLGALILYIDSVMEEDDISHVGRLLKQFQLAYANANAYSKIKGMATYDELTGVYNRQQGMRMAVDEFNKCKNDRLPISVIMIDLDHFKQLNDSYGHAAGDEALHRVAELLNDNVRGRDVVLRYGGEEFVIIMPETKLRDAVMRVDAIRENINQMTIPWNNLEITTSLSAGVACSKGGGAADYSLSTALQKADAALYKAKEQGRNQTVASAS